MLSIINVYELSNLNFISQTANSALRMPQIALINDQDVLWMADMSVSI